MFSRLFIGLISSIFISTTFFPEDIFAQDFDQVLNDKSVSQESDKNVKPISLASDEVTDAAIVERLGNIYANIEGLQGIEVDVKAGVVTLYGDIVNASAEREALQLASQVEGVVGVENQMTRIRDIGIRVQNTFENLTERIVRLVSYLPLLLIAILVVFIFWFFAHLLMRWDGFFAKISKNAFIVDLIKQITRGIIIILGILIALEILDATALLGSLIGAVGLIGLAISFAIRDTVENYIASILLSLRRPFAPNDHIVIDDFEGKVIRLTSRATILMTFDGNHVRVPNAIVYKGVLTNNSRNSQRRFKFEVGIDTGVDLTAARALAIKTLLETRGVLSTPAPSCQIKSLGDSNMILSIYGWTDQSQYEFLRVRSAGIQALKEAFDAADFEMPEPIYRLRIQGMGESGVKSFTDKDSIDSRRNPNKSKDGDTTINAMHVREALGVEKDTDLDVKIALEAANEDDLLESATSQE